MTSEAGIGLRSSRAATASAALRFVIVSRYSVSASSLLLYETLSTSPQPEILDCSASTSSCEALSERNA